MRVEPLEIAGAFLIHGARHVDERGEFQVHLDDEAVLADRGTSVPLKVASAHNDRAGTLRGMHFQVEPHLETKLVWCTVGSLLDVLVDVRPDSETFGASLSVQLDGAPLSVLVPPGVAHGYQTLVDGTVVSYLIRGRYDPAAARTLLWSDPAIGIEWPLKPTVMSEADQNGSRWPPAH